MKRIKLGFSINNTNIQVHVYYFKILIRSWHYIQQKVYIQTSTFTNCLNVSNIDTTRSFVAKACILIDNGARGQKLLNCTLARRVHNAVVDTNVKWCFTKKISQINVSPWKQPFITTIDALQLHDYVRHYVFTCKVRVDCMQFHVCAQTWFWKKIYQRRSTMESGFVYWSASLLIAFVYISSRSK